VTERAIKGFTVEETQRLRDKVKANLVNGGHGPDLAGVIEAEFGVAKRKARIIAEQETSQIVSDFRKDRYRALGSKSYVWQDSGDNKVRPTHGESNNHRVLNRRQFAWDSPPIVDTATGRRCHPGEDFGPCRCVARPVLTFA
jgi:SPP1 gp7 family putative phage head morphogenesis protein